MTDPVSPEPKKRPQNGSASPRTPSLSTRVSAVWVALGGALLLLVLMIIFILQNSTPVKVHYLGLTVSLSLGMAILIAAVGGGAIVAIVGTARILQLRKSARRGPPKPA